MCCILCLSMLYSDFLSRVLYAWAHSVVVDSTIHLLLVKFISQTTRFGEGYSMIGYPTCVFWESNTGIGLTSHGTCDTVNITIHSTIVGSTHPISFRKKAKALMWLSSILLNLNSCSLVPELKVSQILWSNNTLSLK